jgi:hypothetical protein
MDSVEWKEVKTIFWRHKEITQVKKNALLHISLKIVELEQANTTNVEKMMNLFLLRKHKIDALEEY